MIEPTKLNQIVKGSNFLIYRFIAFPKEAIIAELVPSLTSELVLGWVSCPKSSAWAKDEWKKSTQRRSEQRKCVLANKR